MKIQTISGRHRPKRRAQALIETAMAMSLVLLPTLLGMLQYGVMLYTTHALQSIAREAGRFSAVHAKDTNFDGDDLVVATSTTPPSLRNYIKTLCANTNVRYTDLTGNVGSTSTPRIQVTASASRIAGQPVTVTITYPMSKKSFVGSMMVPGIPREYTSTSTFLLE